MFRNQRSILYYSLFILFFCLLFVTVETINGKLWTNDLRVYYEATRDFFAGNNPYMHAYGLETGFFKYLPTSLYLFSPMVWFSFGLAKGIHLSFLIICLLLSIPLIYQLLTTHYPSTAKKAWILYLGFITIAVHVVRELHMGNVNLLLLGLLVLSLYFDSRKHIFLACLSLSLMLVLKPIMILALFPLLLFRRWKEIGILAVLGVLYFCLPILHLGPSNNWTLWSNWFAAIAAHGDYIVSENTLRYYSALFFGIQSDWLPSLTVFTVLAGSAAFFIFGKYPTRGGSYFFWVLCFTAFVPNFFVTDTEHFLLSMPLICYLLYQLSEQGKALPWALFILGFIPFSLNSNDLWGRTISDEIFDYYGLMGLANMLFIGLAIYLEHRGRKLR